MVKFIFNRVINVLKTKPVKLWGLSLLYALVASLACSLGVIPLLYLPITYLLQIGMVIIYLNVYRTSNEPETEDLFKFFKMEYVGRLFGGMLWMDLWVLIWALIPIVGPIFAVIKAYSYRFTPYILAEEPDVKPTQALKKSMALTNGYKGKMFLADFLIGLVIFGGTFVLTLFARIPYVGILFGLVLFVFVVACSLFSSVIYGLVGAAFYEEVSTMTPEKYSTIVNPQPQYPQYNNQQQQNYTPNVAATKTCSNCGASISAEAKFCAKCGAQQN